MRGSRQSVIGIGKRIDSVWRFRVRLNQHTDPLDDNWGTPSDANRWFQRTLHRILSVRLFDLLPSLTGLNRPTWSLDVDVPESASHYACYGF